MAGAVPFCGEVEIFCREYVQNQGPEADVPASALECIDVDNVRITLKVHPLLHS
jgi:hypothetical protein